MTVLPSITDHCASQMATAEVSAQKKVLGTTELLEMILLDVDIKTLLPSQRVNKDFQATINRSTPIQQLLFFEPLPTGSISPSVDGHNPFLKEMTYSTNERTSVKISRSIRLGSETGRRRDCKGSQIRGTRFEFDFTTSGCVTQADHCLSIKNAILNPGLPKPSWYRMLLQQPRGDYPVRVTIAYQESVERRHTGHSVSDRQYWLRENDAMDDLMAKVRKVFRDMDEHESKRGDIYGVI